MTCAAKAASTLETAPLQEAAMKLVTKIAAVLAALALAAPALACGDKADRTADTKATPSSRTVAKADRQKKPAAHAKRAAETKAAPAATAAN